MSRLMTSAQITEDLWYDRSWQTQDQRVFYIAVELWCPAPSSGKVSGPSALGSVRKPALPRRVSEKRESIGGLGQTPNEERRLREKPSWFRNHVNAPSVSGTWRNATCKLSEDGDSCILSVYVDEHILQRSVYIHSLRCTDIRRADRSLFMRTDCLEIHVKAGQTWLGGDDDVIYLKFSNSDTLNTWIALLRSYANPETYGRSLAAPEDGGLYRVWREVYLEIKHGRNLGTVQKGSDGPTLSSSLSLEPIGGESAVGADGSDVELFCEVLLDDCVCARTTAKKGSGTPEWQEQFTFSDLPPFGDLIVNIYRKKNIKPLLIGSVTVCLPNFRRGEMMEGWFPVYAMATGVNGVQVGEIKLRLRVNEEIILPRETYDPMLQSMSKGNMLGLLNEVEQDLKLSFVAEHFMAIAVVEEVLMRDLFELTENEVTSSSHTTLFRGNSVLTKTMEKAMNWYGRSFLEASVGPVIRRLCSEKIGIEVDPIKSGKGTKDQEKNTEQLVYWCNQFWNSIYSVRDQCPQELRLLFQHIRGLVEKQGSDSENKDFKWKSISAFCFLRFFVPAILHPHMFGLCHGMPPPQVSRSLTLIAKVLQRLAFLNATVQKEEYMQGVVEQFIKPHIKPMMDYIDVVSTPLPGSHRPNSPFENEKYDRIQVMNALRERGSSMTTLHREALVFLPHLLDVPKHLAILCSSVLRCSRQQRSRSPLSRPDSLENFTKSCLDVEALVQERIALIMNSSSSPIASEYSSIPVPTHFNSGSVTTEASSSDFAEDFRLPYRPLHRKTRSIRSGRPSTAPPLEEQDYASSQGRRTQDDSERESLRLRGQGTSSAESSLSRAQADHLLQTKRSASLDKRASFDGALAGPSALRMGLSSSLDDGALDFNGEQKKRRGLLRAFLPKR